MRRPVARMLLAGAATTGIALTVGAVQLMPFASAATPTGTNLSIGAGSDGSSKASGTSYGDVRDGDLATYWSPSGATGQVSIKWSAATTVGAVVIREPSGTSGSIGAWQLLNSDTGGVLASGSGASTITFNPAAMKKIIFNITSSGGAPKVAEFETYAGSSGTSTTPPATTTTPVVTTPVTTTPAVTTTPPSSGNGTSMDAAWPTPASSVKVSSTTSVSGTFDGGMKRYYGIGDGSQSESQDPMFTLAKGATLKNVILGAPAGDGVHCVDTCTLINVWWEDVGEDAATLEKAAPSSAVMTIDGGGAKSADDKVFQHNGQGTMVIKNFQASGIGKLYRSCGNCSTQYKRNVTVQNVKITTPAKTVVYINTNYGDIAKISGLVIVNDSSKKVVICRWSKGVTSGEPSEIGSGVNSNCQYDPAAITYK